MNSADNQYVSRAGLKLASVADKLDLEFKDKVVLDVGSSTGGFTDYALRHGAARVIAVDVGTNQLHPSLRSNPKIELHEKTDIRSLRLRKNRESRIENEETPNSQFTILNSPPDIIVIDVSFVSLRQILPAVSRLAGKHTQIAAMLKPQFEASDKDLNKGVIKNDSLRRGIIKEFEQWVKNYFIIKAKADSQVAGSKGNREKFYLLEMPSGR
jgi:23S rRNA (cytidine1920-2'-O)/16S rRNA (cytidine1409-2'-O)-methyltransferase